MSEDLRYARLIDQYGIPYVQQVGDICVKKPVYESIKSITQRIVPRLAYICSQQRTEA